MGSFRRKQYGPVKPVKPPKPEAPPKPAVQLLKNHYRAMSKGMPDYMDQISRALTWYAAAIEYVTFRRKGVVPTPNARLYLQAIDYLSKGHQAKTNEEKEKAFVNALVKYRQAFDDVLPTPPSTHFVKLLHVNLKKMSKKKKEMAPRFDKFTTLMSQIFVDCPFTFEVVPEIRTPMGQIDRKFDHIGKIVTYSRSFAKALQSEARQNVLDLVIDEAMELSRGMAFLGVRNGEFVVDADKQLTYYKLLLFDFSQWLKKAPNAPTRVVKRTVPKPKRPRKLKEAA